MASEEIPFVRITVLGSQKAGKTCLINSFVNNFCPSSYHATPGPSLYYKLVRLPPEEDERAKPTTICVEIEDSFGSNRTDEGRKIDVFFDMRRKHVSVPKGVNEFTPFGIWKPPKIPLTATESYRPLTQGRMGFLLVFDANDPGSFEEAQRVHSSLKAYLDLQKLLIRPIIYFVANKIEMDPDGDAFKAIISQAEQYTQSQFVRLMKVSSLSAKNVKRTFHDMLHLIIGNGVLWEIEYEEKGGEEEEEEEPPFCTQS